MTTSATEILEARAQEVRVTADTLFVELATGPTSIGPSWMRT